ncbi:MAG TPA: hypothetical protein PLA53_01185 [bacterium]|jgi:hypothetical protein|nr:hypothetical protein [bacterium]HNZ51282.1 hypothetical protein [bacterium]HOF79907.1 hypothetical protein [bacterium]HOH85652.1 hypothetical protein [bacterium]HOQ91593.1 hypothetical protein [bacterium]
MEKLNFLQPPNQEVIHSIEKKMDDFFDQLAPENTDNIIKISADQVKHLEAEGIKLEAFLDHICAKHGYLMHGSLTEIKDKYLKSQFGKVFASNRSAIAIMRSIYSNRNVNLAYPYQYNDQHPLKLVVHTPENGRYISQDNGFIYLVKKDGFLNEPAGSWQFISQSPEVNYFIVVETKRADFNYPVEFKNDLDQE